MAAVASEAVEMVAARSVAAVWAVAAAVAVASVAAAWAVVVMGAEVWVA